MKTRKSRLCVGIIAITMALGLSLLSAPSTQATPIEYTLAQLLNGQNVTIGDKNFENWIGFTSFATGTATAIDPADVAVYFTQISPNEAIRRFHFYRLGQNSSQGIDGLTALEL